MHLKRVICTEVQSIKQFLRSTTLLLGKQIFRSLQRLICEVGRTTVINTTVINNRN